MRKSTELRAQGNKGSGVRREAKGRAAQRTVRRAQCKGRFEYLRLFLFLRPDSIDNINDNPDNEQSNISYYSDSERVII